jgi:hypothetical protein
VHRLLERDDASSVALAARSAAELEPHVAEAMHAKSYPPEAWLTLACAYERAQREAEASRCRRAAVAWIRDTALPQVPAAARDGFLFQNPVNRALLGGAA